MYLGELAYLTPNEKIEWDLKLKESHMKESDTRWKKLGLVQWF